MGSLGYTGDKRHVAVIGAGVIGLQTALLLLEDGRFDVTIAAKAWPYDAVIDAQYTSMWSGAQWRSNPPMDDLQQQNWDRQTWHHFRSLCEHISPEQCGIEALPAAFHWDHATDEATNPEKYIWWTKLLPSYRKIDDTDELKIDPRARELDHLSPTSFAAGIAYETFAINPPLYLKYLLHRCDRLGVCRFRGTFSSLRDSYQQVSKHTSMLALKPPEALINCTGLGAGNFVTDEASFPTKGQLLVVKGRAQRIVTRSRDGWEALVIPRPGAGYGADGETVLGGCKLPNDWKTEPDDNVTRTIMSRCKCLAPELLNEHGEFELLRVLVGLRPSRTGGPCLRAEKARLAKGDSGGEVLICHSYGHHSAGFEGSFGAAQATVAQIREGLGM